MQGQDAASAGLSGILSPFGTGQVDMLLLGLMMLIAIATGVVLYRRLASPTARALPQNGIDCAFLFDDRSLMSVTGPGQELLNHAGEDGEPLDRLKSIFDDEDLTRQIDTLIGDGTGFSRIACTLIGQMTEVNGRPVGGMVRISIKTVETTDEDQAAAARETVRLRREITLLHEVIEAVPGLVTALDAEGQAKWRNSRLTQLDEFAPEAAETLKTTRSERVCLTDGTDEDHWYTLRRSPLTAGGQAIVATPIDQLVSAELSLANFVSTLTETFAHLTTGLAIFDSEGKLSLFNPALADLTGVDPTRLIAQPTVRAFLEMLRDQRMVPEQRDFAAWRQTITRLEHGAREGTYREDWQLPSGRVFRVIGRPHPNGAVALIFEDISSSVTLERRYRDEIELGQAALDRISDAVAIFDTGGSLVYANNAFDDLWQVDTMSTLEAPDIAQMTRRWTESCLPTPIWDRLRSYVTSEQSRTSWQSEITTRKGAYLQAQFSPLPNGSTLTVFSQTQGHAEDRADEPMPDSPRETLLELISEDLAGTALGQSPGGRAGEALDLLRSLMTLPGLRDELEAGALADKLRTFAASRDFDLKIGNWDWADAGDVAPADATLVWTLLLTALEASGDRGDKGDTRLSVTQGEDGLDVLAEHAGLRAGLDSLSYRYLQRLSARCCSNPVLTAAAGRLHLSCPSGKSTDQDAPVAIAFSGR